MKLALVRNHDRSGVVATRGRPSPERYSQKAVTRVEQALARGGHDVVVLEADRFLLDRLAADPVDLVFNMAYGIQGDCRYTHLPAMLELAGVPYTGSGPMGHTLALDKVVTKVLLAAAGMPTPAHVVATGPEDLEGVRYPVVVKPRHESTSLGLTLARDAEVAARGVARVLDRYRQPALVEEYVDGREVCVALLGNGPQVECLPIVEIDFGDRQRRLFTKSDKFHGTDDEPTKVCPAPLTPWLRHRVEEVARATFATTHCRDYARVDVRIDSGGVPQVLEINSMASLGAGGSYVLAAAAAGMDFDALVNRIVDVAAERLAGEEATEEVPQEQAV
jgi:D-alanine-D-alanine ligase